MTAQFSWCKFDTFCSFDSIKDEAALMSFFEKHYPDSIGLIGRQKLSADFFSTEPSMLISIKASKGASRYDVCIGGG